MFANEGLFVCFSWLHSSLLHIFFYGVTRFPFWCDTLTTHVFLIHPLADRSQTYLTKPNLELFKSGQQQKKNNNKPVGQPASIVVAFVHLPLPHNCKHCYISLTTDENWVDMGRWFIFCLVIIVVHEYVSMIFLFRNVQLPFYTLPTLNGTNFQLFLMKTIFFIRMADG